MESATMEPETNITRTIYNATMDFAKIVPLIMGPCNNGHRESTDPATKEAVAMDPATS